MKNLVKWHNLFVLFFQKLTWFPPLFTRASVGLVFIVSGWGKIHNIPRIIQFFMTMGFPAAAPLAYFVTGAEFVCGILLLVGAFTRLVSVPLIVIMIVALMTAKRGDITELSDLLVLPEFLYIGLLGWLVIDGPGLISMDYVFIKTLKP